MDVFMDASLREEERLTAEILRSCIQQDNAVKEASYNEACYWRDKKISLRNDLAKLLRERRKNRTDKTTKQN